MEDTPTEAVKPAAVPARTRKSPARRKASASKKAPARRKSPARRRPARRPAANSFSALLNDMASRAAAAGKELKALSGKGAGAARKTISRLTKEWEAMDSKRRAQFVAALLAALAAASAPIVRGRLKK